MTATAHGARPDTVLTGAAPDRTRKHAGAWLYATPAVLALAVWVYGPMVATGVVSFLRWNLTTPPRYVGLANYVHLLNDDAFRQAVWQTGYYVLLMLPLATVVPLGLAVALWMRPGRAATIYRALLFLPVVLAPTANAVSWQFILNPLQGMANKVLAAVGLPGQDWLGSSSTAAVVIVAVTAGKVVGLNVLLFSASLAAIDGAPVEAARVEGASSWEIARYVVVPQMSRSVVLLGLLCILLAGQWVFTNVAILTEGGPDYATDNVYYRLYSYGFTFFDSGSAAAAAVAIVVTIALGYGVVRLVARRTGRAGVSG